MIKRAWIEIVLDNGEAIKYANSIVYSGTNKEYYTYTGDEYANQLGTGRIKGDYDHIIASINTPDTFLSFPEASTATKEIDEITFTDNVSGNNANYGGAYFDIYDITNMYRIWYDVDDTDTAPADDGGTLIEVDITATSTADEIAAATATALNELGVFTTDDTTSPLAVTHVIPGVATDIDDAGITPTVTATVSQQGVDATGTTELIRRNADQPEMYDANIRTSVHVAIINTVKVIEYQIDEQWY